MPVPSFLYSLYEKFLRRQLASSRHPLHVGLILDGNRRFALAKGLATLKAGHAAGSDKVERFLRWCLDLDIKIVTLYGFSTENFNRSDDEVEELMSIFLSKFKTLQTVLFSDTVGFISNLPTKLVESFKATLDDLSSADLLIHVIDAADLNRDYKIKEVNLILDELGINSIPQIRALNKIDLIESEDIWPTNNLYPEIKISSETGEGLEELKNVISESLFGSLLCGWVQFSPIQASVRSRLFDSGCILEEKMDSNGQHQSLVSISQSMLEQFEEIEIFKNLRLRNAQC